MTALECVLHLWVTLNSSPPQTCLLQQRTSMCLLQIITGKWKHTFFIWIRRTPGCKYWCAQSVEKIRSGGLNIWAQVWQDTDRIFLNRHWILDIKISLLLTISTSFGLVTSKYQVCYTCNTTGKSGESWTCLTCHHLVSWFILLLNGLCGSTAPVKEWTLKLKLTVMLCKGESSCTFGCRSLWVRWRKCSLWTGFSGFISMNKLKLNFLPQNLYQRNATVCLLMKSNPGAVSEETLNVIYQSCEAARSGQIKLKILTWYHHSYEE